MSELSLSLTLYVFNTQAQIFSLCHFRKPNGWINWTHFALFEVCISELSPNHDFWCTRATKPQEARKALEMPDSDRGFHRKHTCFQIQPSQPQFCGFLAASVPDIKKSKTKLSDRNHVDPASLSFSSMWCSGPVLSWAILVLVLFNCVKWKQEILSFCPLSSGERVNLSTEFLCLRFIDPTLQLMLWPQELCFCWCRGCCSWLPALSPLPFCTNPCVFTPGSVWISNPCTFASWRRPEPLPVLVCDSWTVKPVVWDERFCLSEPSLHKSCGAFCFA